jgi:hypothetical protein
LSRHGKTRAEFHNQNYVKRLSLDLGYREMHHVSLCGIRLGPLGIPVNLREGEAILVKRPWTLVDLGGKRLSGESSQH